MEAHLEFCACGYSNRRYDLEELKTAFSKKGDYLSSIWIHTNDLWSCMKIFIVALPL